MATVLHACRLLKRATTNGHRGIKMPVAAIDFDHDLGQVEDDHGGYIVSKYILQHAHDGTLPRLDWAIHSANTVGEYNIRFVMAQAEREWDKYE